MCVKSSNISYWNSTILYNYQIVFIETIRVLDTFYMVDLLHPRLEVVIINPSQHYTRAEVSLTPHLSINYIGGQSQSGPTRCRNFRCRNFLYL